MSTNLLLLACTAVAVVGFATLDALLSPVAADGELWVRTYRGGPTNTPDKVLNIAVHPSGEITAVGLSCNAVLILRISPEGKQLWSQVESEDYKYSSGARVVACGEEAVVTTDFFFPYYGTSSSIYRYDPLGNILWSVEQSFPILDMVGDGEGGVLVSGTTDIGDICPCQGYITHYDRQGQVIWRDSISGGPGDGYGVMRRLVTDGSTSVFVAADMSEVAGHRHLLRKYSLAGELNWEREIRPGKPGVGITEISPSSVEGSVAIGGFSSEGAWLARHGPAGDPLWLRTWPASCPAGQAPQLASNAEGVTYAALAVPADPAGSDIRLTAFSPMGDVFWEVTYDSGSPSVDALADVTLAPDGSILVLGTDDDSILLLKYDDTGALTWASRFDAGIAGGTAFAIDPAGRAVVGGSITVERNADFLVLAFDAAGEPRELARFNRTVDAELSRSLAVHVCPNGAVIAALETRFSCTSSLHLVGYSHDGSHSWTRIHPGFLGGQLAFSSSGSSFIGNKLGSTIDLTRYDFAGDLTWSHRFESIDDPHLEGLTVSTAGDEIVLLDRGVCTNTLIAASGEGGELWRQDLWDLRATDPTLAPEGRLYLRSVAGDRLQIHGFDPAGHLEWTRVVDQLGYPEGVDIVAGPGGSVYASGHFVQNARRDWATLRLFSGGSTDWIAHESGGTGPTNVPVRLLLHPEGGVVGAGSVRIGDSDHGVVFRYGEDGALLWRKSIEGFVIPSGLVVDGAGNLLIVVAVASGTRTLKFSKSGKLAWSREFPVRPSNHYLPTIAVGPDLSVAVSGSAAGDSAFTLVYAAPVPVEITDLAAERIDHDVRLTWSVASGLQPVGFSVLYSASHAGPFQPVDPSELPGETRSYIHRGVPPGDAHYVLEVVEPDGSRVRHGPVLAEAGAPAPLSILGPNPNPAFGPTAWRLGLPLASRVRIVIHDLNGRVIAKVTDAVLPAGVHTIPWDTRLGGGSPAPAGVYFYRIEVADEARVGKLVLSSPR